MLILEINMVVVVFLLNIPNIKYRIKYKSILLFCGHSNVVLIQLKNRFFFIALWTDFYQLLKIQKFKYLVVPVGYTYKRLSDLTGCFNFISLALILKSILNLLLFLFIQKSLHYFNHRQHKVIFVLKCQFSKTFAKRLVKICYLPWNFFFLTGTLCMIL